MISLSNTTLLGTGRHRKCYAHPDNPNLCIKIVYNQDSSGAKELKRELGYYAHLSRRLKDWSGLPAYHGTVSTSLGTGYLYDIVKDYDGSNSVSLTAFAHQCLENGNGRALRAVLDELRAWLTNNRIVTMNLKAQNILCQRVSESRVVPVVVDNIGEAALLPLATWSGWFCRRKQARQWQRFIQDPLLSKAVLSEAEGLD
ncbi:PhoP regulatory network protein YrbL [Cedecea colo]|uniref:PhoP regulatory network protein YrbL n=1 Tax=Cedecea colo TaxID=2552946 RepID=A0ABX0VS93_9ENTR|nr:PhoP regulatory network protein YrbL [Cedecea colo]NIY49636.1 PhoP regulatory network protein YrbL [Cedecea colo]